MNVKVKILFLHGLESSPGGTKPACLDAAGYDVINPRLPANSYSDSCAIAQKLVDDCKPDIVVGSSRGGAIAMDIDIGITKLILIAPAWRKYDISMSRPVSSDAIVLHSPQDDVVTYDDSTELADNWGVSLQECGYDHRMNDHNALSALLNAVRYHSNRITES